MLIDPGNDSTYLSVATTPGDTMGNGIVYGRLFQVQPIGEVKRLHRHEVESFNWCGVLALRVLRELPHAEVFGPNSALLLEFFSVVTHAPEEFYWALARNYAPPSPAGIGIQIRDATRKTSFFPAATVSRIYIGGAAMHHAPRGMTDDMKVSAAQAFVDTGWGILTRGLIPSKYTAVCMRTWRKTFGADYA